jgi:putative spermidine/putrescine transport system permease protein
MAAQAPTFDSAAAPAAASSPAGTARQRGGLAPYLLATPLILVFLAFFVVPMLLVVTVSFFDYESYEILIPAFTLQNYIDVFTESVTWQTYWITLKFCLIVWAITLVLGFTVAYYLAFYVRTLTWQMALFLLTTIPFWTSNVIRMISWIPILGRNGGRQLHADEPRHH